MRGWAALLLLLPGAALGAAPDGRAIALHGNDNGALPCAACHGVAGQGNASIGAPRLAGLPAPAIEAALRRFATGQGDYGLMGNIARSLSAAEMQAVAGYFAGQKG